MKLEQRRQRCSNFIFILNLTPGFNGIGQRQLQDETRNIQFLWFGAFYIRGLGDAWADYSCQ